MSTRTTVADLAADVRSGRVTSRSLVEQALARAKAASEYHSTLSLVRDRALERADAIDASVAAGKGDQLGALAGVPFLAKDNMLAYGSPTTAASKILEHFDAPFQAEVVERAEAAGAICIGKTNLDAFAHGGSTENSAFGPTKNPHDMTRVPGGTSGGAAASVALDIVPFALGSDTGGSIRQPASFCGVVGLRPTYGTVSRYGVIAMASSTDTIGVLAHHATDVELVMSCVAGQDTKDSTTLPDFWQPAPLEKPLTIGVIKDFMTDGVQPEVRAQTNAALDELRALGHTIVEVELETLKYALAVYYIVVPAETSSNLARYDGIKYGERADGAKDLGEAYARSRTQGLMPENKRRILIGNYVLSSGYYDAYYEKAQTVRTLIARDFANAFAKCDVLVGPVAPTTAFELGANTEDPLQMYLADIMTVPAALVGIPGLSVPNGTDTAGLPIGLQMMGPQRSDTLLLALAAQLEAHRG